MTDTQPIPLKIFKLPEWQGFEEKGVFNGSPDDKRDGFIHLSFAGQLLGTLNRYFNTQKDVMLASVTPHDPMLYKLEISRGGEPFPHYYGPLKRSDIVAFTSLSKGTAFTMDSLMIALKALGLRDEGIGL